MAKLSEFIVDGYLYTDRRQLDQANKELEGVNYVRSKTNLDNPQAVLRIYRKMIEQEMFTSQVGLAYLRELQDYLYSQTVVNPDDILPIPVAAPPAKKKDDEPISEKERNGFKAKIGMLVATVITMLAVIIVMFVIMSTSGNQTILNYENEVIDKYSAWEIELTEREASIRAREVELGM